MSLPARPATPARYTTRACRRSRWIFTSKNRRAQAKNQKSHAFVVGLQEKPLDFYQQFHVIVLGLDSLEARRYMNSVACSFLGGWAPQKPAFFLCYLFGALFSRLGF